MYKNKSSNGRNNVSGLNIKRLRMELPEKTSQRLLAYNIQLLGLDLDKNAIQRIESGERFVTDIELKVFASYFGVSADELLKNEPKSTLTEYEASSVEDQSEGEL